MMTNNISKLKIVVEDGSQSESYLIRLREGETKQIFFDKRIPSFSFKDRKSSESAICSLFLYPNETESIVTKRKLRRNEAIDTNEDISSNGDNCSNQIISYGPSNSGSRNHRKIWITNPEKHSFSHMVIRAITDDSITIKSEKKIEVCDFIG
jgi:hypothetical protein